MNDCDPLLAAGVLWCRPCRADAYPTSATWLGDDLLIAAFPDICRHHPGRVHIITPSLLRVIEGRCRARTAAGTWCRNLTRGDEHCFAHNRTRTGTPGAQP